MVAGKIGTPMTTSAALACSLLSLTSAASDTHDLEPALAARIAAASADEFIPVDVILVEQTDQALLDAAATLSDKRARRAQVIAHLRETATHTQAPLLEYLRAEREAGGVRGAIESLWIHNVVSAEVTPRVVSALAERSDVALVHYDPPRGVELLANAPLTQAAGGTPTCGLDLVRAPEVWSPLGITGQGVVVGVIDSGLCSLHPDIAAQLWTNPLEVPHNGIDDDQNGFVDDVNGWNFRDGNNNTRDDLYPHGSAVSGAVAGDGTSGVRCGIAPGARIMVLKCITTTAHEQSVWDSIQYGLDNGADVLNGSLGWYQNLSPQRAVWRAVCDNTLSAGVVLCFIAGNEGCGTPFDNVRTPGDVPGVITVGAVDCNSVIGSFSSCGPVSWQNVAPFHDHPHPPGLKKPDVCAPGVSAQAHDACAGYFVGNGTSLATPHVSGLAALLLQADPRLDPAGVKAIIEATATDLGAPGKDNVYGSGRIDAFAAVQAALSHGNYCAAKPSSCSTLPSIYSVGSPSVSATSGFTVHASGMRARQPGLLIYSAAGSASLPVLGGHLCVQNAARTQAVADTTGTPGACDGVLSIDMNAFRAGLLGGMTPLGALSIPGSTIHCQFVGRDPGNSFNVLLTAALEFTVRP
jgi:serine protease AprX